MDKLETIKEWSEKYGHGRADTNGTKWLISEVERLRGEVVLYKGLYSDACEVYALSVKKENDLQAELAALRERSSGGRS